ncbi:uncharacterized protein LOC143626526 [Bidens hawaiensis]|uniref:uncharacterized protein LOC143626526 n=1 Tax=Bidens hawaiensis TaxID=980011 RepID=UPI00404A21C3
MKEGEVVGDFLSKDMKNVKQKRGLGVDVSDQTIVEKVLRSLQPKWDHVVTAIEELKDRVNRGSLWDPLLTFDQLMGSLQAHEGRVNRGTDVAVEEQAFQAREEEQPGNRGHGREFLRGRGRGHGRFSSRGRGGVQCYNCNKFGHVKSECWSEPRANAAVGDQEEEDEDGLLYMAIAENDEHKDDVWFIDSGCSNHMGSVGCLRT